MNDYEEIGNDDRLAQRLRREARRSRPAFSTALHERVLAAVQATANPPESVAVARRGSRGRAISWVMTAAASVALILALAIALSKSGTGSRAVTVRGGTADPGTGIRVQVPVAVLPELIKPHNLTAEKESDDFDAAAEELANSATGIGDWVRSAAGDGQWGGLDRDAQRALATVAGPLPFDLTFSVAKDAD